MLRLIHLFAAQRRVQPSCDAVYFVVYAGLVRLTYGCRAQVNIDTSLVLLLDVAVLLEFHHVVFCTQRRSCLVEFFRSFSSSRSQHK